MNKFLKPGNYVHYTQRFLNSYVLDRIESMLTSDPQLPLRHPPIFFLGAPRSGSTLAVQGITDALDVGYMCNRHCQFSGAPALAERFFRPIKNRPDSDFRSLHGSTKGAYAPAECGEWWYRFFRRKPPYVTLAEVDPLQMQHFRHSVAALTNAFDRPILFKNQYASLRIQPIAHYLPESLFIITHRDEVDNGHSLLETRYKVYRDYQRWWSMEPPEIERLVGLPAHQQVIEQIRHIQATIEQDLRLAGVSKSRRFDLYYEEFCANPENIIAALREFMEENNCLVNKRGDIPAAFKRRSEIRIDKALYAEMESYAQKS